MKSLNTLAIAAIVAIPSLSFANGQQPPTHEQVRNEFLQLRAAGFNPRDAGDYPDNIQAAEARLSAIRAANAAHSGAAEPVSSPQ